LSTVFRSGMQIRIYPKIRSKHINGHISVTKPSFETGFPFLDTLSSGQSHRYNVRKTRNENYGATDVPVSNLFKFGNSKFQSWFILHVFNLQGRVTHRFVGNYILYHVNVSLYVSWNRIRRNPGDLCFNKILNI
jgi:hypothetical protein